MEEVEIGYFKKEKSAWTKLSVFLLILVLSIFAGNVIMFLIAKLGGVDIANGSDLFEEMSNPDKRPFIKTGFGLNHLIIFTGTSLLFAFWLKRKQWKTYFQTEKGNSSLIFSCLLLLICAYPIIGVSATFFEGVEWAQQLDETNIEALMSMLQMDTVLDLLVNLIIIAVLPAIGEELLFRGILQNELIKKIKNHHIAIVIASIIFSGVHLQIQGFLPKFFIGLILGYTYYWTKSIWYPILLHFINNGMQTVLLFFMGDEMEAMQNEAKQPEMLHLVIVVVFSCFLCYLIIRDIMKKIESKRSINL